MTYDDFISEGKRLGVSLSELSRSGSPSTLSNEALFHLPFLVMTILVLARGHRKPELSELGQLVGECLERSIRGFKGSSQGIGWSANLRIRTVKALAFVELSGMATVSRDKRISATEKGRRILDCVFDSGGRLSLALQLIERSQINLAQESQLRLRIE